MARSDSEQDVQTLRRSTRRSVAKQNYKVDDFSSGEEIEVDPKPSPVKKARKPLKIKNDDEEFVPVEDVAPVSKGRKRKSPVTKKVPSEKKKPAAKRSRKAKTPDSGFVDSNNNMATPGSSKQAPGAHLRSDSDSDDEDGWEDECEIPEAVDLENYKPDLPAVLQIDMAPKKKTCGRQPGDWINAWIQQNINKMRKTAHLNAHKVHLLTFVGRLRYLNSICNNETVRALALSIIPDKIVSKTLTKTLEKFEDFFFDHFSVNLKSSTLNQPFSIFNVMKAFESSTIDSQVSLNVLLIIFLRTIGLTARLVYFLNPISVKCPDLLTKLKRKTPEEQEEKKSKNNKKKPSKKSSDSDEYDEESDDDEDDSDGGKKKTKKAPKKSKYFKSNLVTKPEAIRYWIEIFDDTKKVWKVFESEHNHVRKDDIVNELPGPIRYILAIDNEGYISEVTARYADDWYSHQMHVRRLDDVDWWTNTLKIYSREKPSKYEKADTEEFAELLKNVPLPTKMADYKNHKLFILEKHVLKFQAIYPRDCKIVGYFRNQPVYPRDCVYTLRSRENWLRRAKSVKLHEVPYKVVMSSFRTNPNTGNKEDLELFGEWQIEDYVPPTAKNGIVPRNAYNNVELFMDCMLPYGTVHLKLPGLARIAAKLNIDCVPAVVGFDTAKGGRKGSHPVIDGFVVCSEFEETLIEAWEEEQENIAKREEERRVKRIYGNWKRLIKGLLIRRKLANRFRED